MKCITWTRCKADAILCASQAAQNGNVIIKHDKSIKTYMVYQTNGFKTRKQELRNKFLDILYRKFPRMDVSEINVLADKLIKEI